MIFNEILNKLEALGFSRPVNSLSDDYYASKLLTDNLITVRAPRGETYWPGATERDFYSLVFEMDGRKHRGQRFFGLQLKIKTTDHNWEERVKAWLEKAKLAAAQRHAEQDAWRAQSRALTAAIALYEEQLKAGAKPILGNYRSFEVVNDGKQPVGISLQVLIKGTTSDEVLRKLASIMETAK
jgi:hypothetical protein